MKDPRRHCCRWWRQPQRESLFVDAQSSASYRTSTITRSEAKVFGVVMKLTDWGILRRSASVECLDLEARRHAHRRSDKGMREIRPTRGKPVQFGVLMIAFPFAPTQSQRCWSVMMKRMFGLQAGAFSARTTGARETMSNRIRFIRGEMLFVRFCD